LPELKMRHGVVAVDWLARKKTECRAALIFLSPHYIEKDLLEFRCRTLPPLANLSRFATNQIDSSAMVLRMRLARFGRRSQPFYNIVVSHAR
jgi:IS1 family transposase